MPSFQHSLLKLSAVNFNRAVNKEIAHIQNLRRLANLSAITLSLPAGVKISELDIYGMATERITPKGADPRRTILFVHGGGYALGSLVTHRALAAKIAKECHANALVIDYRLAPEFPFPAALEDTTKAFKWLLAEGYLGEEIIMIGDSAGGGLILSTLMTLRQLNLPMPKAAVLMSPWADLTFDSPSAKKFGAADPIVTLPEIEGWGPAYAGTYPLDHPLISPLEGELDGFPPILIQVSDCETLTDDATRLATKIKEAGGEVDLQIYPGLVHVWQLFWRLVPEATEAIDCIAQFTQKHWQQNNQRPFSHVA